MTHEIAKPRPSVPALVAPYVEALGYEAAADFLLMFGGAEMSFATDPKGKGMAEERFGAEAVARLRAHYRIGHRVRVPLAKKWLAAVLAWRGLSIAGIARELRASDVSVRKWLRDGQGR